ncbi:MAG: imidazole glycerol phosphate synthase subunit HisH [Betaproteobacteria bacterium]|nr:imidazole glycerol phosphate synthase subunit HisH [Betaproteobacteria bacterium]
MIAIVDYGSGNLRSVLRAFRAVAPQTDVQIVDSARQIDQADRVVFPGQGAMHDCMASLDRSGLRHAVLAACRTKPFFGICVGEQMLFDSSEEGDTDGLGVLPGEVVLFSADRGARDRAGRPLKVPHMGWNQVQWCGEHPVLSGVQTGSWFYFVHSFHAEPKESALVLGQSDYGTRFTCAVARDNIIATQFHPEKSANSGLKLLSNFVTWNP